MRSARIAEHTRITIHERTRVRQVCHLRLVVEDLSLIWDRTYPTDPLTPSKSGVQMTDGNYPLTWVRSKIFLPVSPNTDHPSLGTNGSRFRVSTTSARPQCERLGVLHVIIQSRCRALRSQDQLGLAAKLAMLYERLFTLRQFPLAVTVSKECQASSPLASSNLRRDLFPSTHANSTISSCERVSVSIKSVLIHV